MLGLGIAVCAAVVFICLFWVAKNKAFSGSGQTIFEGFMFLIASYLITIVAFAMLKFKNYEKKLEAKLTAAANVSTVSLYALHDAQAAAVIHMPIHGRLLAWQSYCLCVNAPASYQVSVTF